MAATIPAMCVALSDMAQRASESAASVVAAREQDREAVDGWLSDAATMRGTMPGALIKDKAGALACRVPASGAVHETADGVKMKIVFLGAREATLKDSRWVQEHLGDAVLNFFPSGGSSSRRAGARGASEQRRPHPRVASSGSRP